MNNTKTRLSLDDRINLLAAIAKGKSLTQISKQFGKHRSTYYREIKKNIYWPIHPHTCSACKNRKSCTKSKGISQLRWICPEFSPELCDKQRHFPYVCNNCEKLSKCNHAKCYYNCIDSFNSYKRKWKEQRSNKTIFAQLLDKVNEIVSNGVKLGQSIHHIYESSEFLKNLCSEVTIRRYLYSNMFEVKPIDLPRYKRYSHKYNYEILKNRYILNIAAKENRTFQDFQEFCRIRKVKKNYWEYDSVEGNFQSKKAIFTITFVECNFQFGILIRKHNPTDVCNFCNWLFNKFPNVFKVNLCDNGIEFVNFHKLENNTRNVFFTSTYRATDKAHCERNHELIRYIIPKSTNFDHLTQDDINLMFSHINSYIRKSLNNKTPYECIVERFGKEFVDTLRIKPIDKTKVQLKDLFK